MTWQPPNREPQYTIERDPRRRWGRWHVQVSHGIWVADRRFTFRWHAVRAGERCVRRLRSGRFVGFHFR